MGSNNQNSISDPKIFIPACALLTAVHLVWAQLWARDALTIPFSDPTSGSYSISFFTPSTYFGLAWTYAAILLALGALSLAAWRSLNKEKTRVTYISTGLLVASLEMAILNISQSLFTSSLALKQIGTCNNTSAIINATRDYASNILLTFPGWFLIASLIYVVSISILCIVGMKNRISGKSELSKYQWWAYNAFATIIFGGLVLTIRESSLGQGSYNTLVVLGVAALAATSAWLGRLIPDEVNIRFGKKNIEVKNVIIITTSMVIYGCIWLHNTGLYNIAHNGFGIVYLVLYWPTEYFAHLVRSEPRC